MQEQRDAVNRNRSKLLNLFCDYDLSNISKAQLDDKLKDLNIETTQAYETFMRKQGGSLHFNEFVHALTLPNDNVVTNIMAMPNTNTVVTDEAILNSPHRKHAKAIGGFNTDISKIDKSNDFLKWKGTKRIHSNDEDAVHQPNDLAYQSKQSTGMHQVMEQSISPQHRRLSNTERDVKTLCKMYCQEIIDIDELERGIARQGIVLNASQQRMICKCKINPNVKLSELILAFHEEKQVPFSEQEAINAMREPLIFAKQQDLLKWFESRQCHFETADHAKKACPQWTSTEWRYFAMGSNGQCRVQSD